MCLKLEVLQANQMIALFSIIVLMTIINRSLTGSELISQSLVDLGLPLSLGVLLHGGLGPLLVEDSLLGVGELGALLTAKRQGVVRLVPAQSMGDKRKWRQPAVYSSPRHLNSHNHRKNIYRLRL